MLKRKRQPIQPTPDVAPVCVNSLIEHPLAQSDLAGLAAGDAEVFDAIAAAKRASAVGTDPVWAAQANAEAAGLEALAASLRDPAARGLPALQQGRGGETAPLDDPDMPWKRRELAQAVAASPSTLAADASLQRLVMARNADVLVTAVEIAHDAGAETAAEKALAHQLAAAHRVSMGLFAAASDSLHKHQVAANVNPGALEEATRAAAVGARVLSAFAQGTLALDRLRHGNRQTVQVQHVVVNSGGQAVVAGTVTPGVTPTSSAVSRRGGHRK